MQDLYKAAKPAISANPSKLPNLNDLLPAPDVTCTCDALLVKLVTVPFPPSPAVFVTTGALLALVLGVDAVVVMMVEVDVIGVAVTEAGEDEGVVDGAVVEI